MRSWTSACERANTTVGFCIGSGSALGPQPHLPATTRPITRQRFELLKLPKLPELVILSRSANEALVAICAQTPFPPLRHVNIRGSQTRASFVISFLPVFPSLRSLAFSDLLYVDDDPSAPKSFLRRVAELVPSTLLVLRVGGERLPGISAALPFEDIFGSVDSAGLRSLRQPFFPSGVFTRVEEKELQECFETRGIMLYFT